MGGSLSPSVKVNASSAGIAKSLERRVFSMISSAVGIAAIVPSLM